MSEERERGEGGRYSDEDWEGVDAEGPANGEAPTLSCEELLALKEEELKQSQDRLLRMAAEMDNTRKRIEREKSEGISYANEGLIREMLPVIDNLERAVRHAESDADFEGLLDGIRMTLKGFLDGLSKFGCAPFDSVGRPFDPNYHEAVLQQESSDYPEKTVVQEFQRGYTLRDRLLRPALVAVSKLEAGGRRG